MFFLFFLDICKFCITLLFFYLFSIFMVYAFLFLSIFYSFFAKSYIFYYDNVGPPYYFCAVCEKPIIEGEELPDDSPDDSVCCDNCALWFHFHCVQVRSTEEVQEWLCQACLEDLMTENLNVIATD